MKKSLVISIIVVVLFALLVGMVGCTGPAGPQGIQGPAGPQGAKGDKGERGPQGEQGLRGVQGPEGEKGDDGDDGDDGEDGERGPRGYTGATGPQGLQGEPGITGAYVLLVPKDSGWVPQFNGTVGVLFYIPYGSEFVYDFTAQGLAVSTSYSLVYYRDPWPSVGGFAIATGLSDSVGDLSMSGSVELNSNIPISVDDNFPCGKIWLVPSSDYPFETTGLWNPANYLFEFDTITYIDTDLP